MDKQPWIISEVKSVLNYEGIYDLLRKLTDLPIHIDNIPNELNYDDAGVIIYRQISFINNIYTYNIYYVNLSGSNIDS